MVNVYDMLEFFCLNVYIMDIFVYLDFIVYLIVFLKFKWTRGQSFDSA